MPPLTNIYQDFKGRWDPTQGWQVDLEKAINAVTGWATADPWNRDANSDANRWQEITTKPNAPAWISKTWEPLAASWLAAVNAAQQWTLEGSYWVNLDQVPVPSFIDTPESSIYNITKEKEIHAQTKEQIKRDSAYIDFNNKEAGSWAWLDVDFWVTLQATKNLMGIFISQGREKNAQKFPESDKMLTQISEIVKILQEAERQGMEENDPRFQQLVANYKLWVQRLIALDQKDSKLPISLKNLYLDYERQSSRFNQAIALDWATLKDKYNKLLWAESTPDVQSFDLRWAEDKKLQAKGSRIAKEKLLNNSVYQSLVRADIAMNPMHEHIFAREAHRDYITDYEKQFIKQKQKIMWPQIMEAYQAAVDRKLSNEFIEAQFGEVMEIFHTYDNLTHKDIMNDEIYESTYWAGLDFNIASDMWDGIEQHGEDKMENYEEEYRAEQKAKMEVRQRVNKELYWWSSSWGWSSFDPDAYLQEQLTKQAINAKVWGDSFGSSSWQSWWQISAPVKGIKRFQWINQ